MNIPGILLILTLLSFLAFIFVWWHERRSLFLGFYFLLTLMFLGATILVQVDRLLQQGNFLGVLLMFLAVLIVIFFLLVPFLVSLTLITNGLRLARQTSYSFGNLLALLAGILLLANLVIWQRLDQLFASWGLIFSHIYHMLDLVIIYILFLLTMFAVTSWLNLWHLPQTKEDYLIVLGAGLIDGRVSPVLAKRIDKAVALYRKASGAKLIMSGGQGADESRPEAVAMAEYAQELGVPVTDILLESASTNTWENIRFSQQLIPKGAKVGLVTNSFHVLRALLFARKEGLACRGYGSHSKFYFTLNAFIREFVGYLVLKRKLALVVLILLETFYVVIQIFNR
ncbi:YdcF family protein [Ligilactobacillus equi]|uniref:YdcF family protein n=1 Tax=Ligilactobacillus equi TaxID=137357 RepID=UPI002ED259D7